MRLLVVEDDDRSAAYLKRGLSESGHVVDVASDGELGLALAMELIYDGLIVDRLLPKLDGIELVRRLRATNVNVPVIMVSALASAMDRVEGLRAGCDDYLAKPFFFSELLARIEAITKHFIGDAYENTLVVGDLSLDIRRRIARRHEHTIDLQFREFLLLQALMRNAGSVVTRSMLLEAAWDYDFDPRGNIVDMRVHRLRKKIDMVASTSMIITVPGAGYMIRP
ncbi:MULTISPECIES: response regulator transcription factor [unclassified Rhizobium]|jgi:two-component system OmpR family response regulator|uniref:response regulator transcription factor n=1 Tax=unclassified Rhizobium TaxID=2613769 RepID=UPI000648F9B7|nr:MULTISPECIES: response regulator transcription factor [unclassified Rhizobium]MBN8954596.1 response regulator transcription factor [Rhizobium tropici]OJY68050.1 MAG: DNA-binding response regulator [Rhizobium sp. 60-20]RKD40500.1 two-component system OmpR family response regulator [Rhizobium sp. WW_1]